MNTLNLTSENSILNIELNRPEVGNAFNPEMIGELTQTFRKYAEDPAIKMVVLSGAGKHFCSGGDLGWMKESVTYKKRKNISDALELHDMFMTLYRFPKPLLAKVHGAVYGGGVGLCAAADVVVADEKSTFCLSEVRLGLLPAVIAPFVMRKIGLSRMRALGLSAKPFTAEEARQFGLVHDLGTSLDTWVSQIMQNGPTAMASYKQLLWQMETKSISLIKARTTRAIAKARTSKEGQEGLKAFFEKRPPAWRS